MFVAGLESRIATVQKATEVDPLPPGLRVCFQQLREGATSIYFILNIVTGKYLISRQLPVASYQLRQSKRDGVLRELCPYF